QRDAIEEVIEPYLIQQGLVQRTSRGRVLTGKGWAYLGLEAPDSTPQQPDLLDQGEEPGNV
ncbi:MAG: hypothetical protein O3B08_19115, partial [Proteobacteria bacterium]|nr:hypothetical protein [Pseudomonadota bacterium]